MRDYNNPWIPEWVHEVLRSEQGTILDVGGGASPFYRASAIVDFQGFDPDRLTRNAWGGKATGWAPDQYFQLDLCTRARWPFDDKSYSLGLCSHTIEDLRDPIHALSELGRICHQILIITPSRLLESMRGVSDFRYSGFPHHPWIVYLDEEGLVFRRKTPYLEFRGCHLKCPPGRLPSVDAGVFVYHGKPVPGREQVYFDSREDVQDFRAFVTKARERPIEYLRRPKPVTLRARVYDIKRWYLGES